jgi:GMP synthase (glutamine-hydrolysing)
VVAKLQEVDLLVRTRTAQFQEIWQVPVVSLPLVDESGNRVFLQRPVCSRDAMTASPFQMDFAFIRQLEEEATGIPGVAGLWYDVTDKPPGTIEWE